MLLIIFFLIFVFIGVPIFFALALASLIYVLLFDPNLLFNLPQRLFVTADNFNLMAIPFFVLVGEFMNSGGITRRLIDFTRALVGHFKGGLAYVTILISGILASLIGSSNAVAAITSSSLVPEMRKDGYSNEYASAVAASASLLGPIIPPSVIFILYGVTATTSISAMFLAGIIPGLILIVLFCIVAYIYARKENLPVKQKENVKNIITYFIKTLPAMLIPIVIIGGITTGIFTPTESGAIGVLLAFLVGKFLYKDLKIRDLPNIITRAGILTGSILVIAAAANYFGWILTLEKIPQSIIEFFTGITDNPIILLLLINLFLLIIGLFIEPLSAILIVVPVLLPLIDVIGIDPIQFGLMVSINLIIGMITPPVGIVLFIVSSITKVDILKLSKKALPYIAVSILLLLLVTLIPEITTYLPKILLN